MIIDKNILNKLKDFGLNSYESKLWTALLSRSSSTAGELSDIAGVPRSRSYDVLESLERKGFILMKLGKPIKYIAIPPSQVLESIKKKTNKEAEEKMQSIENLKTSDIIKELNILHSQGIELVEPVEISGTIKGRNNIDSHMDHMLKKAKSSVIFMLSSTDIERKHSLLLKTLSEVNKKGINIRLLSKSKNNNVKELSKYADIFNISIDGRFCIIDNKEVLFMLTDNDTHPSYEVAVWLNTGFFASTISSMLNNSLKK